MIGLLGKPPSTVKPAGGVPTHARSLRDGLMECFLFAQGGGLTVPNLAGRGDLTVTSPDSPPWRETTAGVALGFNGSSTQATWDPVRAEHVGATLTVDVVAVIDAAVSTRLVGIADDGGWGQPIWSLYASGTSLTFWCLDAVGGTATASALSALTIGLPFHAVGRFSNKSVDVFLDGVKGSGSTTSDQLYQGTGPLELGYSSALTEYLDGAVALARIWSRALTDEEIWSLAMDPWSMFRGGHRPILRVDDSAVTPWIQTVRARRAPRDSARARRARITGREARTTRRGDA